MDKESFVWKVAGAAGEGIMTTGLLLSKTCARHGLYIFDYTEYPSLIRGGHNTYQVHASKTPIYAQRSTVDLLIALNEEGIKFHQEELTENSLLIYDSKQSKTEIAKYNLKAETIDLPMIDLAKEAGGKEVMANNVALGASIYLLGLDSVILNQIIADVFGDKGEGVVSLNQKAAQAGYNFAKSQAKSLTLTKQEANHLTMTGNEAIALGALAGGLQFYVAYPMSPSSSILHFLAEKAPQAKIVVKHAEDEISAANMALGASFAGARVMVGTSGGGFCYMVEALGLAGIAEVPIVFVEAMRPGSALGLPTWTAQGDLQFVISASHGEFPRFVLAPGDAQEAFELSRRAQELAEKFQTPVIILSDKYLSESRHYLKLEAEEFNNTRFGFAQNPKADQTGFYPRYALNDTGVSSRTIPGTKDGAHITNSYTHNQYGLSDEEPEARKNQLEKIFKKVEMMKTEIPEQHWEKESNAEITFISFGSTKMPLRQAKEDLKKEGITISVLNLSWLWPFPSEQVKKAIENSKNVVVAEGN